MDFATTEVADRPPACPSRPARPARAARAARAAGIRLDQLLVGDNALVLRRFPRDCIDLTVMSPPYDGLRPYYGHGFDFFALARQLWRVTAPGGVLVWVVADEARPADSRQPGETGTSFEQALHFRRLGFTLHATMIALKTNKIPKQRYRYERLFEYMFVFCKGPRPRTTRIGREPCRHAGKVCVVPGNNDLARSVGLVPAASARTQPSKRVVVRPDKPRGNVWHYETGRGHTSSDRLAGRHPAPFPEKLVLDHLESWSDPGDVVLDPFAGSGTTCKVAQMNGRRWLGIEVCPQYVELATARLDDCAGRPDTPPCGRKGDRAATLERRRV